jgi:NADPH:quinone reductase-like Zn-dependent oxidoreductase
MKMTQLEISKAKLEQAEVLAISLPAITSGQVRIRVERFAFTANNITYAAFGEAMKYWRFFPSTRADFGVIPVWGFGVVVQSDCAGVAVGERLYGYWPMASEVILAPAKLTPNGFMDSAEHRRELHPVYNQYVRVNQDPFYTGASENIQALLRPLFTTSFLIDDFFADNDFFGAKKLLLSSASSKTAFGTAHQLIKRTGIEVIGLTSEKNRAYCESLGCYTQVLSYEQLNTIADGASCAYVDFAGNSDLRLAIHTRFKNLKYSCSIGGTHVTELGGAKDLPGPKATLFFAPAQIKKRHGEWGAEVFGKNLITAWHAFCQTVQSSKPPWLEVEEHSGTEGMLAAYHQVLAGESNPRIGHIVTL